MPLPRRKTHRHSVLLLLTRTDTQAQHSCGLSCSASQPSVVGEPVRSLQSGRICMTTQQKHNLHCSCTGEHRIPSLA
ncbi:hypothetical protein C8T65DRAFT_630446 [Cerioporus squamosus]|nr:hypothetical protein C8T65DRAFT_630446 [Cerioporus squamosus]